MKMTFPTFLKIILATLLLTSTSFISTQTRTFLAFSTPGTAIVRVVPSEVNATLSDTISISVVFDSIENMAGYEFKLFWNTSILRCTQWDYTTNAWIEDPSTPPWSPSKVFTAVNNITDMPDGRSRYWLVLVGPLDEPVSGSITVANFSFNVTNVGETVLDLSNTLLGDKSGSSITHNVVDGVARGQGGLPTDGKDLTDEIPLWGQWWFWIIIVIAVFGIAMGSFFIVKRGKQ